MRSLRAGCVVTLMMVKMTSLASHQFKQITFAASKVFKYNPSMAHVTGHARVMLEKQLGKLKFPDKVGAKSKRVSKHIAKCKLYKLISKTE